MDVKLLRENDQIKPTFKKAILQETTRLKSAGARWRKNKTAAGHHRGGHRNRGGSHRHVRPPLQYSRRVIVRNRIVRMNAYGKKAAALHLKYIERDGVEQDGSKGLLYGSHNDFERDAMTQDLPGEQNQFRFIISPEDGDQVDLTALTRRLVRRMEMDSGRQLIWGAVNHYNTDNPHTHLVIRGVDTVGKEVRFERNYITSGIRHQAADLLTKELGSRARVDVVRQFVCEVAMDRYTSLDAAIKKQAEGLKLDERGIESGFVPAKAIKARLRHLQTIQLAFRDEQGKWRLDEGWENKLRGLGKHAEIIDAMRHRHQSHDRDALTILKPGHEITGRVTVKGLSDEMYDRIYVDVEAMDGRIYHIETGKTAEKIDLKKGDLVAVKLTQDNWLKPSDQNILTIANQYADRVYTPERHVKQLQVSALQIDNKAVSANNFVEAHVNRLKRLAKEGIVSASELAGGWEIPTNLIDRLNDLNTTKPVYKLNMKRDPSSDVSLTDQTKYAGRVWLDRFVDAPDALSSDGFAGSVRDAAIKRAVWLKFVNVTGSAEERNRALDQLEREQLAERFSARHNLKQVALKGKNSITGKLEISEALASGRRYGVVVDGRRGSFSLVPWRKDYEPGVPVRAQWREGKLSVTVMRNKELDRG